MRQRRHRLYVDALKANGTYEAFVEAHGSETCFVCGRGPKTRRLAIDHDHRHMYPRGLLCPRCNRILEATVTSELLRAMADYLDAARDRWETMIAGKSGA